MRAVLVAIATFGLASLCGSLASAQDGGSVLILGVGEEVRLRMDVNTGALSITSRGPASPLSEDLLAMARSAAGAGFEAMGENSQEIPAQPGDSLEPIVQNELYVRFVEFGSRGRLLLIEDGYDLALQYRAVLVTGFRLTPTDVCTVRPQLRGFEFWPYPSDGIQLSVLTLMQWPKDQRPICQ